MQHLFTPDLRGGGGGGGGGGVLPSSRLMGMYCWMGLHFHGWIDYNVVTFTFSLELLEWDPTFLVFGIWGIRKFH